MLDLTSVMEEYVIEGAFALDELDIEDALESVGDKFKGAGTKIKGAAGRAGAAMKTVPGKAALGVAKGGSHLKVAAMKLLNRIRQLIMWLNEKLNQVRKMNHEIKVNPNTIQAVSLILSACNKATGAVAGDPEKAATYLDADGVESALKLLSDSEAASEDTAEVSNSKLMGYLKEGQKLLGNCGRAIKGAPDRETLKCINKTVSVISRAMNKVVSMSMKGSRSARKDDAELRKDQRKLVGDRKKSDRETKKAEREADKKMDKSEAGAKARQKEYLQKLRAKHGRS